MAGIPTEICAGHSLNTAIGHYRTSDKMNVDIDKQYAISQPYCHSDLVLRSLIFFLNTAVLKKPCSISQKAQCHLVTKISVLMLLGKYSPHIVKVIR